MSRTVSWWQRHGRRVVRGQRPLLVVEPPDKELVQAQVRVQDVLAGRIGLDHVGVRPVVAADGERAWWSVGRLGRADLAVVLLHVGRFTESAVIQDRQYGDGAPEVVGDQQEPAGRVKAD